MDTYKVVYGAYNTIEEHEICLPKGTKLLYEDGVFSGKLNKGHNYYLACFKKDDIDEETLEKITDTYFVCLYEICDLYFVEYPNIKFIGETPEFYTPEEFMGEFRIRDYYFITKRIPSLIELGISDEDLYNNSVLLKEKVEELTKICSISKITEIKGPCSIRMFEVANHHRLFNKPDYLIHESYYFGIGYLDSETERLSDSYNYRLFVEKEDVDSTLEKMMNEMITNVIDRRKL